MGGSSSKPAKETPILLSLPEQFSFISKTGEATPPEIEAMIKKNAPFVGTIVLANGCVGTACLLKDGTILTCLHVILDYEFLLKTERLKELDFSQCSGIVFFVKKQKIYTYSIESINHSSFGYFTTKSLVPISGYDYAVLNISGNPTKELDGFFEFDPIQHRSTANGDEPLRTLAISGPQLSKQGGVFTSDRYCSVSANVSAQGEHYHLNQEAEHFAVQGLSGQAVLPIETGGIYGVGNSILYAIHSALDYASGTRVGIKISEYLYYRSQEPIPSYSGYASPADIFFSEFNRFRMEVLRRADVNFITGKVTPGEEITLEKAIALLQADSADIIADTKKEAQNVGYKAWGKLVRDDKHQTTGKPHFHDIGRTYKKHVFY